MPQNTKCTSPECQRIEDLQRSLEEGIAAVNTRIDHVLGRHDFAPISGCIGCETRRVV